MSELNGHELDMSIPQDNKIDIAELVTGGSYEVADALLAAVVQAETLDRVTWIERQGKIVAAIAPDGFVARQADDSVSAKLDEILGIIRGEELCAVCGQPAQGYARGEDGKRLCLGETRKCYTITLYEQSKNRLSVSMRTSIEQDLRQGEDNDHEQGRRAPGT